MKDTQELASCHLTPDRFGGLKVVEGNPLRKGWIYHERKKILHCLRQQPQCRADADALSHATILGTANLKGWELLFKGSKTGSYLTIEESEGGTVPVVIWEVTATDEAALDRYEGFPTSTTSGTSGFSTKASAPGSAGR